MGKSSTQAAVLCCGIPAAGVGVGDGPMVGGVCIFSIFLSILLNIFLKRIYFFRCLTQPSFIIRDHSVNADSASATPTTTTENTTMITITTRTRRRRISRMGSCRPTPTTTAECLTSTQQGTEVATATSVNVNMDLASRTHRWSLWYMCPQESRFDQFHHN